ncbi:hypothetical protein BKA56DRAFT_613945 [Ilyonectria sp. MPI-CAGE-AT-0026]|nr:hypothetical protein BKA56DRAFT_613945 [Ilyonectria sp. MPI-CAGE-AT-0026]
MQHLVQLQADHTRRRHDAFPGAGEGICSRFVITAACAGKLELLWATCAGKPELLNPEESRDMSLIFSRPTGQGNADMVMPTELIALSGSPLPGRSSPQYGYIGDQGDFQGYSTCPPGVDGRLLWILQLVVLSGSSLAGPSSLQFVPCRLTRNVCEVVQSLLRIASQHLDIHINNTNLRPLWRSVPSLAGVAHEDIVTSNVTTLLSLMDVNDAHSTSIEALSG